jgi:hypothetical protein
MTFHVLNRAKGRLGLFVREGDCAVFERGRGAGPQSSLAVEPVALLTWDGVRQLRTPSRDGGRTRFVFS